MSKYGPEKTPYLDIFRAVDSEAYSKMELFVKIVSAESRLTISAKRSILDVWLGSELHFFFSRVYTYTK